MPSPIKRLLTACDKVSALTTKPPAKFATIWRHRKMEPIPRSEHGQEHHLENVMITSKTLAQQVLQVQEPVLLVHGTHDPHDFIIHAENCPHGLIKTKRCERGDGNAALYGAADPQFVANYTGLKWSILVAAKSLDFDEDTKHFFIPCDQRILLLKVFQVSNHDERESFVVPPLPVQIKLLFQEFKKS